MSRRPTDWKTILPKIVRSIEEDYYSPSVAAALNGVSPQTLSEHCASNPEIRKRIEQAKLKRLGDCLEKSLVELMRNPKSPHHFNALRYFGLTQGRDYGWSENPTINNVQNFIALMPGVNAVPFKEIPAAYVVTDELPTVSDNGGNGTREG